MGYRDRYGELANRSPLLAQILQQMQQRSQYKPQSYGALAAGLGAAYFDKRNLEKELRREQKAKDQQAQSLAEALGSYTEQSRGGPIDMPNSVIDESGQRRGVGIRLDTLPDPEGARQGLSQALAGLGMPEQALGLALQPPPDAPEDYTLGNQRFSGRTNKPIATGETKKWSVGDTRDFGDGDAKVTQEFVGYDKEGNPTWKELGRGRAGPLSTTNVFTGELTQKTENDLQEQVLQAERRLPGLYTLRETFDPSYLTFKGSLRASMASLADKTGVASEQQKEYLGRYSTWAQGAANELNRYIKDVTGSTVGQGSEEARIRKGVPDYQDDSPTAFISKLERTISELEFATARTKYVLAKGMKIENMTIDEYKRGIATRAAELDADYRTRFPNMKPEEIQTLALNQANREFMR